MLQKLTAVLALLIIQSSVSAPLALALVSDTAGAARTCAPGTALKRTTKRVRVTVRVRVHGRLKRKRVWRKRTVRVCAPVAPARTVAAKDATAPTVPTALEAAAGNGRVLLVWVAARDDVGVTGYRILRNGTPVATVTTTSFTDTGVTNGTRYRYEVIALDAAGNASAAAAVVATPQGTGDTAAPTTPPAFRADAGDRRVDLSWGAATDDVKVIYYELRRDGAPIAFQESTTFTDSGLANGTTYGYSVIAYDQAGNASAPAETTATPADTVAPGAPTGLAAIPADAQVSLTWTAPGDNVAVTGYRVYRGGELVASPSTAYYLDAAVTNGTAYGYTVTAVDAAGNESAPSIAVMVTPMAPIIPDTAAPTAPVGVAAAPGDRQVALSWGAATDDVGVTAYEIRRGGTLVAVQPGTTYTDIGLANGTSYTYTVRARDAAGNVGPAGTASATPADTVAPTVPSGLTATPGDAQVALSWSASTDNVGVTGYRVYRGGILVASPSTPYFNDTSVTNGTAYAYAVAAVDGSGNASAPSAAVSATPVAPVVRDTTAPSVPTGLTATGSSGQVALSWTASADAVGVTGYRLYRDGVLIALPSGTTFTDTGLANGVDHAYRVAAVDAAGNVSAQSPAVTGTPADTQAPTTPTALTATAGDAQVALSWTASTDDVGVTGYRVYRDGVLVASPSTPYYGDTGLVNGTARTYRVAAVDAAGNVSSQSAAVTATPVAPVVVDTTPPSAPPGLTATAGDRQVTLAWGASTDAVGVTGYEVYRGSTLVALQPGTTYTDTGLTNGTAYTYTVKAHDEAGNVSAGSSASATPADTTAPSVPSGVAATPGDGQVALSWTASTDNVGVTGYRVYRGGVLVASPANAYYVDTGVANGTAYSYRVAAVDGSGNVSAQSPAVSATPVAPVVQDVTAPSVPTGLSATPASGQVALTWNASTDDTAVTAYRVYRDGLLIALPSGTTFTDTGLPNGVTHTYAVAAADAAGNVSAQSQGVTATPADTTAPSVPAGLSATAGDAQVALSWTASTDNVGVTGYRVYRGGVLIASPATPTYTDTGVVNGTTYSYRVAAVDASGNVSAQSAAVPATPVAPPDTVAPSVPAGLSATPASTQVALSWTAATDNVGVTGYRVYRGGVLIAAPAGTTYTDTGLTNGTAYTYRVAAVDAAGNVSAQTTAVSTTPADTTAPSVPSGVAATPGDGQVALSWTASTDNVGVTGYRVYRGGVLVASPATPYYVDAGLVNGTAYSYRVAAVDGSGNASAQSAAVSATPVAPPDTAAPSVPSGLAATPGNGQVALSWSASTDNVGVTGYRVYRGGVLIAAPTGTSYTDTGLTNGTAYGYTVAAVDAAGNVSAPTAAVSATPADTTAPSVPAGLSATAGDAQVALSWTASTDNVGVTGYRVYRGGVLVGSPATPYYVDTGLTNGTAYSYRVAAVDAAGNLSAQSAAVTGTPVAAVVPDTTAPSAPGGLTGTAGTGSASLSWTASTDNVGVTGYRVYRGGVLVGSPAGPSYTDTGLTNGTAYSYTVKAIDAAGNLSAASNQVSVTPGDTQAPTVPTGLALVKNNSQHSITFSWTASTDNIGVVKYRVYRKINTGAFALLGQPTTTSYADLNLANGKTYTYTVEALDAAGNVSAQAPAISTFVS